MSSSSSDGHARDWRDQISGPLLSNGPHRIVLWPYDEMSHVVLMSVPRAVDLTKTANQVGLYGGRNLTSLPSELHWAILDHLSPVDRVCFGLTCKKMANTIINGPRPNPEECIHIPDFRVHFAVPDYQTLLPRLAHGWVDKTKFRYCWKCCKLLPKNSQYFHQRLAYRPIPEWRMKVGMEQKEWRRLKKSERYEHLVQIWCDDRNEDSSILSCNDCSKKFITAYTQRVPELFEQSPETACYQLSIPQPIQCPICFGAELCKKKKSIPKRNLARPFRDKVLIPVFTVTIVVVSGFLYGLYHLLIKTPWLLTKEIWKQIRSKMDRDIYWRYWLRRFKLRCHHK